MTCPIIKSDFGECTVGGLCPEEFPSTRFTWALIARRLPMNGVQRRSCGKAWAHGFGTQSLINNPDGISITKAYGNSAASDQQTFAHGLLRQTQATQSQRGD